MNTFIAALLLLLPIRESLAAPAAPASAWPETEQVRALGDIVVQASSLARASRCEISSCFGGAEIYLGRTRMNYGCDRGSTTADEERRHRSEAVRVFRQFLYSGECHGGESSRCGIESCFGGARVRLRSTTLNYGCGVGSTTAEEESRNLGKAITTLSKLLAAGECDPPASAPKPVAP